jgi:hypothetical protein
MTAFEVPMLRSAALSILLVSTPALAFVVDHDSTGAAVSWHQSPAFVIDSALAQELNEPNTNQAILAAVATYQSFLPDLGITVSVGPTSGVGYDPNGSNENSISAPAEWEFDADAIAITIVTTDTTSNELVDTDIALNTWNHVFKALDAATPGSPFDDIQNTVTHELGHALGMAHNPDDATVVMYPTSPRGQISKRTLTSDDQSGLQYLYGAFLKLHGAVGCTSSSRSVGLWPLLALLMVLLRKNVRRMARGVAATSALMASSAWAAPAAPAPAPVALSGTVIAATTEEPSPGQRLLHTFVQVRVDQCLSGPACPSSVSVEVPGGRIGHIEQRVIDAPTPKSGEKLGLIIQGDPSGLIRTTRAAIFHLSDGSDLVRFMGKIARLPPPAIAPAPSR